jgi:excisionase family DNA binding protein
MDTAFSDRVFTVAHLRVSKVTIYALIKQGKLTPFDIGTRTLFSGGELSAFVERASAWPWRIAQGPAERRH